MIKLIYLLQTNKKLYEEGLKDKNIVFLISNDKDYISFIKAFKDSEKNI